MKSWNIFFLIFFSQIVSFWSNIYVARIYQNKIYQWLGISGYFKWTQSLSKVCYDMHYKSVYVLKYGITIPNLKYLISYNK